MPPQKKRPARRKKQSFMEKKIPYAVAALFTYILYATQFFTYFADAQRGAYQNHFGDRVFHSISQPQTMAGLAGNLQQYFVEIMTSLDMNQMFSFIEDGMGFGGIQREKIEAVEPDGYRFIRRHNLVHETERFTENPHNQFVAEKPVVYLFNTHDNERFNDGKTGVVDITKIMKDVFTEQGIPVLMEDRSVQAALIENFGPRSFARSYEQSRVFMEETIYYFPSVRFFFDIHRDAPVSDPWTTIDGEEYARIMLVIGTDHPYYRSNLEVAKELIELLEERKPGIVRNRSISMQGGPRVNGVYGQDISAWSQLFEIGDINTPPHAAKNTARILAEVLSDYIRQQDLHRFE